MKRLSWLCVCVTSVLVLAPSAQADLILHYNYEPGTTQDDAPGVFEDQSPVQSNEGAASGGNDGNIDPVWDAEQGNVEEVLSNKSIAIDNANGIATSGGTFTVAGWYKGTDTGYYFDQLTPRLVLSIERNVAGAGVHYNPGSGGTWYANGITSVNDGSWHHIAFVFTNNTVDTVFSIYLDGVAQDVDTTAGIQLTRTMTGKGIVNLAQQATNFRQRFFSNNSAGNDHLSGLHDDLRVYDTALSAAEVSALYTATASPGEARFATEIRALSPREYYRLRWTEEAIGTGNLAKNTTDLGQTSAPALTPAGGFAGFRGFEDANSWASFDGVSAGDTLTALETGFSSTNGTLCYWVRMDGTGDGTQTTLFSRGPGGSTVFSGTGNDHLAVFQRTNGSLGFRIDGASLDLGTGLVSMNEWHFLVFTWARNSGAGDAAMRIYLDGEEIGAADNKSWDGYTITEARFGKELGGDTRQLKGSADEIAIFDSVLSAADVTELWRYGKGIDTGTVIVVR